MTQYHINVVLCLVDSGSHPPGPRFRYSGHDDGNRQWLTVVGMDISMVWVAFAAATGLVAAMLTTAASGSPPKWPT